MPSIVFTKEMQNHSGYHFTSTRVSVHEEDGRQGSAGTWRNWKLTQGWQECPMPWSLGKYFQH